ncbi:MAG: HAD family hydrolase [Kofleriaceae bacterium]|nr:HAD family hydrolase [Kofleriaceae bacterium]MCL4223348.1 haloacid dehalogenase-like hydrolase [Myxococcales bacterium]
MIHYLFDIDGTLLRAGGAGARALTRVMEARHGVADACRGLTAAGRTDPDIVRELFERALGRAPTTAEIEDVIAAYLEELERTLAGPASTLRVLPGARAALDWLAGRDRVSLAIATGNVRGGARIKLDHAGLADRFDLDRTGGYGCDSPIRAELVARAVERAGAGAADTVVVVGDTVHDVSAARAVGALCVAVTTGGDRAEVLAGAGADVVIDHLDALASWHDQRFAG